MDNPEEDSGLEFADEGSVDEESLNVGNNDADETDEGISIGNLSQQLIIPCAVVPPHIQLQEAHAAYLQQQDQMREMLENNSNSNENGNSNNSDSNTTEVNEGDDSNSNPNVNEYGGNDGFNVNIHLQRVGDDNNNDQADDVNNNTTDPQLQQIQQQQEQLLLLRMQQDQSTRQEQPQQLQPTGQQSVAPNPDRGDPKDKGKKKKKKKKKNRFVSVIGADGTFQKVSKDGIDVNKPVTQNGIHDENDQPEAEPPVEIEYVPEKLELSVFDPMYRAFANVFENFRISDSVFKIKTEPDDAKSRPDELSKNFSKVPKIDLDDELEDQKKDEKPKLSKRKLKKLTRLSVAELKQVVPRPDVVEMHDVTARDPKLLIHLKSYRNTVPVPRHWCFKRKYLQGKRGIEKAPFDLPGFIKKTGIMEMRAALAEKEETKTLKAKMRERVRPKMGKIDIDYQKLHDAFFKWQSKPKMTIHGDLYYEGKEFETRMKDKKPGELSDDLRTSLGMPVGPNANRVPPPWLIAMQRYGPPPSYPHLKVPGLNAPIPEGCSFGYHAGGWGKPPVDEFGRPLYGDVFGITNADGSGGGEDEFVDKSLWGQLESDEEPESEEEEEEEEKEDEEGQAPIEESGLQTPAEGLATPSGFSSIPAGLETPELIELRKRRIEQDMEGGETPTLFTVLPEKRVDRITGSMMASTHVYDMTGAAGGAAPVKEKGRQDQGRVELALDPSELDLDTDAMAARYEQKLKEDQSHLQKEDLSDMVAEHAAKQKSKRKRQLQQQDTKQTKKYKEFKF